MVPQSLWLFRLLELCHLGKIEHAMVKRDLSTGVPMVSPGGLQQMRWWSPALHQLLTNPGEELTPEH